MTFPKMVGQIPLYYNRLNTGRPTYDPPVLIDDIPVGAKQFSVGYSSCWLETATEPLFPFGYGLSYTTFEYGETEITNDQFPMTISCRITNTGTIDAYEVPQLYTRQRSGDLARPILPARPEPCRSRLPKSNSAIGTKRKTASRVAFGSLQTMPIFKYGSRRTAVSALTDSLNLLSCEGEEAVGSADIQDVMVHLQAVLRRA